MSKSVRVTDDLFASATAEGNIMTRSAAMQIEHWARLGRALEYLGVSMAMIRGVMDIEESNKQAASQPNGEKAQNVDIFRSDPVMKKGIYFLTDEMVRHLHIKIPEIE